MLYTLWARKSEKQIPQDQTVNNLVRFYLIFCGENRLDNATKYLSTSHSF